MVYYSPEITESTEHDFPEEGVLSDEESGTTSSDKSPDIERDQFEMPEDTYTLLFVSKSWGVLALAIYVFLFKLALFALLLVEDLKRDTDDYNKFLVLAAQVLLIPVAVAMQQDLTGFLSLLANVKYSKSLTSQYPGATYTSYVMSLLLRFIDGMVSLAVNVIVLFHGTAVLSMFLNFAALHFLQSIDDIVGLLCLQGFFGNTVQEEAKQAKSFVLPARREDHWLRDCDSIGIVSIILGTFGLWAWYVVSPPEALI